jgi:dehydrogenase/reductase SDR family member 12
MVKQLFNIMCFYSRFLLSFSNIGYVCRRLIWSDQRHNYSGQTWLVTGASGGIGKAVVEGALNAGARVIAVARSEQKLAQLKVHLRQSLPDSLTDKVETYTVDLSLQHEVKTLIDGLSGEGITIDVLVNNVGVLLDDLSVTEEGVETSFATNLLNHYQLTQALLDKNILTGTAVVVNVTSGGLYNAPLSIAHLDIQSQAYNGVIAYTYHKRAQAVLTQYWREKNAATHRQFYAMHPGWVDTQGVKDSLPTFRKILKTVLRDSTAGADTILWLVSKRPHQSALDAVWFDRNPRKTHFLKSTMHSDDTKETLVAYLRSRLLEM